MKLIEIIKSFPEYRIFRSLIHPKRYYAILEKDVEKMELIKKEFTNKVQNIPDSFTIKALPLITTDNDFCNDFDPQPTHHRINDLIEEVFIREDS